MSGELSPASPQVVQRHPAQTVSRRSVRAASLSIEEKQVSAVISSSDAFYMRANENIGSQRMFNLQTGNMARLADDWLYRPRYGRKLPRDNQEEDR
jgi:hypothetical protein